MPISRVFYGWWVTLALAAMVFVSTGIRFTVGPFLKPITADLGLDRATFSLVISAGLFLYGACMPVVGWIADRVGARSVAIAGTFVLAAAAAATGLVGSLWQFFLVYALGLALGLAATGPVVATTVVSRWFVRRRATALSLLGAASMGGMSLLVPLVMWGRRAGLRRPHRRAHRGESRRAARVLLATGRGALHLWLLHEPAVDARGADADRPRVFG
ncbi:MAG: MFS transporter, partial [Candidatus Rokuibacteriota bacterium]